MTFRVGMKCICIDDTLSVDRFWCGDIPQRDEVYTVAGMFEKNGVVGLILKEIKNVDYWNGGYKAKRFRPAVIRKTSIDALKALLVPGARKKEEV